MLGSAQALRMKTHFNACERTTRNEHFKQLTDFAQVRERA